MAAFLLWPLACFEFGTYALDYLAHTLTKETR